MKIKHLSLSGIVVLGASALFTSNVGAFQATRSGVDVNTATVQTAPSNLIASRVGCPQRSGGSMFVRAETRSFLVYICGGDNPNTYVGVAKNGTTGGITLPLRSYSRDRFVAVNGNTRYTLTRSELIVTRQGRTILRERAQWRRW
ncbi:MAG TPA: hypothetical protein DCE56_36610 [Cyanobacteria bacterium UBA8553]|nr:hypothetical protein [Cyanobacteria bacterium UBA8553]